MRVLLNIGLRVAGEALPLNANTVRRYVNANIGRVIDSHVGESDTEPTLVVLVSVADARAFAGNVFLAAEHFRQDCIAVVYEATGCGQLIGPQAERWGAFNPHYFLTLDGSRLSEVSKAA